VTRKKALRDHYHHLLSHLSFPELITRSSDLSAAFFHFSSNNASVFRGLDLVSFYPFQNEPQINVEREARDEPYQVAYVRIENWDQREMTARRSRRDTPDLWEEFEVKRGQRIFQPKSTQPFCEKDEVSVILVPGLAFTAQGARLGRGAGFYDRFLRLHPSALRVGIGFQNQIAEFLPEEEWDERVDIVLTDQSLYSSNHYDEWKIHGKIKNRITP
jgi:5,10-methenyltetrahydrofolate synthetase